MGNIDSSIPRSVARREFLTSSMLLATSAAWLGGQALTETQVLGPLLGHVDEHRAFLWLKSPREAEFEVQLWEPGAAQPISQKQRAEAAKEGCITFAFERLEPNTVYRYEVLELGKNVFPEASFDFRTLRSNEDRGVTRLVISSCAKEDAGSREVWKAMAALNPDGVVLLGDTPYIDSTDRQVQLKRHTAFAAVPEYRDLLSSRPCWWTWDDHDFAGNNSSGLAAGKENSLEIFKLFRPQTSYGNGSHGIYIKFRVGEVEVFLLDTRWFSMTEPSFAGSHLPSLLGQDQWEWLQKGLKASTATFKILACGVIWDDKENSESDDWGTYQHELKAIQAFIGSEKISGVILMGGDIHASRVLKYPTSKVVGYDLVQFIASPIHGSTIPSLNVYHPALIRSAVEPHVFLEVVVDASQEDPTFDARLVNRKGETVFSYAFAASNLRSA